MPVVPQRDSEFSQLMGLVWLFFHLPFFPLVLRFLLSPRTRTCQDSVRESYWWIGRTRPLATLVGGMFQVDQVDAMLC